MEVSVLPDGTVEVRRSSFMPRAWDEGYGWKSLAQRYTIAEAELLLDLLPDALDRVKQVSKSNDESRLRNLREEVAKLEGKLST